MVCAKFLPKIIRISVNKEIVIHFHIADNTVISREQMLELNQNFAQVNKC